MFFAADKEEWGVGEVMVEMKKILRRWMAEREWREESVWTPTGLAGRSDACVINYVTSCEHHPIHRSSRFARAALAGIRYLLAMDDNNNMT